MVNLMSYHSKKQTKKTQQTLTKTNQIKDSE